MATATRKTRTTSKDREALALRIASYATRGLTVCFREWYEREYASYTESGCNFEELMRYRTKRRVFMLEWMESYYDIGSERFFTMGMRSICQEYYLCKIGRNLK